MDIQSATDVSRFMSEHILLVSTIIAWSLAWKGIALWKAARLSKNLWFIILLIVNTVGILDIIFVSFVASKYKIEVEEVTNENAGV